MTAATPPSVCLFTRALEIGGTERQLVTLARALDRTRIEPTVLTYYPGGPLASELTDAGIRHASLAKRGRWDVVGFTARLASWLRYNRPNVLHSFLTTDNLFAALAGRLAHRPQLVWGARATYMDLSRFDTAARLTYWLEGRFAGVPASIVANAHSGRAHLVTRGFSEERIRVVPNGIDPTRFRPNPEARKRQRTAWGVSDDNLVIGCVARLDPMKDHETLLAAFARLAGATAGARLVCVGDGERAGQLRDRADALGISGRVVWTGAAHNVEALYPGFDLHVSASYGEAFPNSVAEAMATGIPNVATDVGDCARILGETGWLVPARDPEALATTFHAARNDRSSFTARGAAARRRIEDHFSVTTMATSMTDIYLDLIGQIATRPNGSANAPVNNAA